MWQLITALVLFFIVVLHVAVKSSVLNRYKEINLALYCWAITVQAKLTTQPDVCNAADLTVHLILFVFDKNCNGVDGVESVNMNLD